MEKPRARVKEELEAAHAIEEKELELHDAKRKAQAAKEMNEIEDQLEKVALATRKSCPRTKERKNWKIRKACLELVVLHSTHRCLLLRLLPQMMLF